MTTTGLISYIQRKCPDWDRQTLLDLLNDIQNMVFMRPNHFMRVYDESTGKDPVLTTVSGTYKYELSETLPIANPFGHTIQLIDHVYQSSSESDTLQYNRDGGSDLLDPKYDSFKATKTSAAKIIFHDDPGSTDYKVKCYRRPNQLTSERIQLEIPEEYHIEHIANCF